MHFSFFTLLIQVKKKKTCQSFDVSTFMAPKNYRHADDDDDVEEAAAS